MSEGTTTNKKSYGAIGIGVAIAFILGVGVWYGATKSGDKSDALATLSSAEHTIAAASISHLDSSYRRVQRALRAFPTVEGAWSMLWGAPNQAGQVFDPSKPESWTSLGIDPEMGAVLTLDARLVSKEDIVPLMWVGTSDLTQAITFLAKWSEQPLAVIDGEKFKSVAIGPARMLFATKGDVTVLTIIENNGAESVDQAVQRLKLAQVLESSWAGKGPSLAQSKRYKRALSDSVGQRHVTAFFDFENFRKRLDKSAAGSAFKPATAYVTQWIEALAIQFGDQGAVSRVVTTTPGQTLAEQLMSVKGVSPKFARRISQGPWSALRWSINLKQVLDGMTHALPPSAPEQMRMGIGMVRIALPMATGISWEALCRAFSGHFMVAARPGKTEADPFDVLMAIHVNDAASADSVIASATTSLSTRVPATKPQATTIAGVKGWTLSIEQHTLAVVRDDDMILAGPINAVEEAIKMKGTAPKASSPVTDIDQDSVFNLLIDGSPLIGKDLAKSVTDDREMMAFIAKPFFSVRATLDNRGLLWSQTRPAHIEDLMAYFSTMPSIALPFDFPVKL